MSRPHDIVKNGMSLPGFFRRYPDDLAAEAQFEKWRWPTGPECPHCASTRVAVVKSRRPQPYRCKSCRRHFSFKTDTPMHDSKLGAQTWLLGLFLIVANPKGKSSVQLAADLGITQKSAWHLSHRIRRALAEDYLPGFDGPIEVDEAYIGGKSKWKHADKKHINPHTPVFGVIDNASGQATAVAVHEVTAPMAAAIVRAVAAAEGIEVHTDGSHIYDMLPTLGYDHHKVLHTLGQYVNDQGATTNHVENYWSTLKRIYVGTYHWWSPEHLHRYLEEHTFRFNRRRCHVVERMAEATASMNGKRLSWQQLTRHGHHNSKSAVSHA
ncbi:MAG: IS1595 family transposase [Acidimicrobiaceae bacterium]|nr:IS1595 family transposase [Acidimicrobiaceae bacterium]